MSPRRLLLAAATALVALLLVPALASASVDYVSVKAKEIGGDGVVGPGDVVSLTVTVRNTSLSAAATTVRGTVSGAAGVSVQNGTASFGDIAPDGSATNLDPLVVKLPSVNCGDVVPLTLQLTADGLSPTTTNISVVTGVPGPFVRHAGAGFTVPDAETRESSVSVPAAFGTVRDVRVTLDDLTSPAVDDLQLELVAPGGTPLMVLPAHRIAGGGQFHATSFGTRGASISTAQAPYTGMFLASSLTGLLGTVGGGPWSLRVADTTASSGTTDQTVLTGWSLDLAKASCDPQVVARLTGPSLARPNVPVTFDASDSTAPNKDGDALAYTWEVDGTPLATESSPQIVTPFATRGTHTVKVTVSDPGSGLPPSSETVTVNVAEPPNAALDAAPASVKTGDLVTFDASGSSDPDPSGTLTSYSWDFDGNGTWDATTPTPTTTFAYVRSGTYPARVRVTNDLGASAIATVAVTVANRAPKAALAVPAPVVRGVPAVLNAGASSDPDGSIAKYEWDLDGNGSYETSTGTASTVSHVFDNSGTLTVGLRVTDDEGAGASTSASVHVTDAPVVSLAADPESARPGDMITLTATASDPDGAPDGSDLTYAWDLDGRPGFEVADSPSPTTTTTFDTFADHVVRVRVKDAAGATATAAATIKIVNNPPVPALAATPNPVRTGETVTFDASGSTDADGPIAQYRFDLDGDGVYETAGTAPTATRAYPNGGRVTVRMQVEDADGARRATSLELVVQDPPPPPPPPPGDGGHGSGGGKPGGDYGGSSEPTGPFHPTLGGAPIQSLKAALKVGVTVLLNVDRSAKMSLRATVQPAEARRLRLTKARGKKAKPVLVGTASVAAPGAGQKRLALKLTRKARKRVAKARRMTLVLDARVEDSKGHVVRLTRVVLLRR